MNAPVTSDSPRRSLHAIAVLSLALAFLTSLAGVAAISARVSQAIVPVQARVSAGERPARPMSVAAARHLPWTGGTNYSRSGAFGLN
ncbi:MAG TPA: hypothetical protein VGA56_24620 [Opitutaceae bacterium]